MTSYKIGPSAYRHGRAGMPGKRHESKICHCTKLLHLRPTVLGLLQFSNKKIYVGYISIIPTMIGAWHASLVSNFRVGDANVG